MQAIADGEGVELSAERLWRSFEGEYLDGNGRFGFIEHKAKSDHGDQEMTAKISDDGKHKTIHGHGNGPVDGFVDAMRKELGLAFDVADYREHAMGHGANAAAIAYVELRLADGSTLFGVGIDKNIVVASLEGGCLGREPGAEALALQPKNSPWPGLTRPPRLSLHGIKRFHKADAWIS